MIPEQLAFSDRPVAAVDHRSAPEAKIALFRALFRGREDVYPRRFESRKTGKTGYQPACGNEWVRGVCEKPRIKCSDCPHQRFLSVADDTVQWHLSGHDNEAGNTVFLDGDLAPYSDQWAFLSTIERIARSTVENIVRAAEAADRVLGVRQASTEEDEVAPWAAPPSCRRREPPVLGPLPASLELILGNDIYIAKDSLSPSLGNRVIRLAAFQNPEFYKAQAMRLPTYDKPRIMPAPRITLATSHCRADAWMICRVCYPN
jgi:hypothetical protein